MSDQIDPRHLPPREAAKKNRLDRRHTPLLLALRFGNTDELSRDYPAAAQLAEFADAARAAYVDVYDTHWRSMADPLQTEPARLVRSAKHAKTRLEAMRSRHDAALDAAERTLSDMKARMDRACAPPSDAGSVAVDAEVRAMIRATTDPDAALALAREFPRAVVSAPRSLTGTAPEVYASLRTEFLTATVPDVVAEYTATREALEAAHTAATELEKTVAEFVDFDRAAEYAAQGAPREAA